MTRKQLGVVTWGLVSALTALGCEDNPPVTTGGVTPPSASTAATSASAKPEVEKPTPLDVAGLQKTLKCQADAEEGACGVLAQMKTCETWNPVTQSGEGRWMGLSYRVTAGAFVEEVMMLRSRRVGTAEVDPGQLPAKIAIDRIPDNRQAENAQAKKAIKAIGRGDVAKPGNTGVDYVKKHSEWRESYAIETDHNQVYVALGGGAYVCALDKLRLAVVQRSERRENPGDGVYGIVHPVSW